MSISELPRIVPRAKHVAPSVASPSVTPQPVAPEPVVPVPPPQFADSILGVLELERLSPIGLAEVNAAAALQTRVDRKYLVPSRVVHAVLEDLRASHHVLTIDGRRATTYASQYFDTPAWTSLRAHAQGRRRRWKVRTRLYCEDQLCRLELKTKVGVETVKHGLEVDAAAFAHLTQRGREFLGSRCAAEGLDLDINSLTPGVRVDYVRAALCNVSEGTRLTIDGGLVSSLGNRIVRLRPDHVLIETKGGLRASSADRVLRAHGAREASVSKYSLTLSMMEPSLPGHRWSPLAHRFFSHADC